jgi:Tfp pilus assembly protein PilO
MKRYSLSRERLLALAAVGCLSLLALDRLLFTPLSETYRARAAQLDQLGLRISRGSALLDQETSWLRRRDDLQDRCLPALQADAESLVLARLDAWATEAGVALTSLRPSWREERDGPDHLDLQLMATGTLDGIVKFLFLLETEPLALTLEKLELNPAQQGSVTAFNLSLRLDGLCRQNDVNTEEQTL